MYPPNKPHTQAVLGDELTVPAIDGSVKYTVPEGTQTGTIFRLKGKGIKKLRKNERGDQYVKVYIEVPKNLDKSQKDFLKEYARSMDKSSTGKHYRKRKSFFEGFKELFNK